MKTLVLSLLVVCYIIQAVHSFAPTENLLKKAYCACRCCNKDVADTCYKNPAVTSECTDDDFEVCKEETFCERWHQQKCVSDCFCRKCKDTLPESQKYKCQLIEGVPEDCECGDDVTIECPPSEEENTPSSTSSVLPNIAGIDLEKKKDELKAMEKCMIPCFCKGCRLDIPADLEDTCKKTYDSFDGDDCTCDIINAQPCNNQAESARFFMLKEITGNPEKRKEYIAKLEKGIKQDTDKDGVSMKRKCQLKCVCDNCLDDSPFLKQSCTDLTSEDDLSSCPDCVDEEVKCPGQVAKDAGFDEMRCKFKCLCKACGEEIWSKVPSLQSQCNMMQDIKSTKPCDCDGSDVTCPYNDENIKQEQQSVNNKKSKLKENQEEADKIKADFVQKQKLAEKKTKEIKKGSNKNKTIPADQVKCKFQCMCNECKDLPTPLMKMCNDQSHVEGCGKCENVKCPTPTDPEKAQQNACSMICLCTECKDHRDLKGALKDTCKKIISIAEKVEKRQCDCDAVDVDCSEISKMKKKLKLLEEKRESSSKTKEPKLGKIKEKVKIWDEL